MKEEPQPSPVCAEEQDRGREQKMGHVPPLEWDFLKDLRDDSACISLAKFSYVAIFICKSTWEIHLTGQKYIHLEIKFPFLKGRAEWILRQAARILCLRGANIYSLQCFKGQMR